MDNGKSKLGGTNIKLRNAEESALTELGKVPPHSRELEEAVLGAMMLERDAVNIGIDILRIEVFYFNAHQVIFEAIKNLFAEAQPIDLLTVVQQLKKQNQLDVAGGYVYLADLTNRVTSAANIEIHSRILAELAMKRGIITMCVDTSRAAYDDATDVFTLLDIAEKNLFDIYETHIRKDYAPIQMVIKNAIEELNERKNNTEGLSGVPTGFYKLDDVTGGFQKSDLIIVAARPGMGKTAFILSAARNAAIDHKKSVAVFSLEMSSVQLVNRLISSEAEISSESIRHGNLSEEDWSRLQNKVAIFEKTHLFIDDTPALSILELRAKCRKIKAKAGLDMIVIDYLQLMTADINSKAGNREQEIAYISRSLKNLAKEMNVPVIALSQLNRQSDTRGTDKRPKLSDLRESGSIEQDADMVLFLFRPEYYDITQDEDGNSTLEVGEVIIEKNRHGKTTTVALRFLGEYTKFTNWESRGGGAGISFNSGLPQMGSGFESGAGSTKIFQSRINNNGGNSASPFGSETNPNDIPF